MYLMKGMAVLAMGLVAASCNKMEFDQDAYQRAKEQESKESFMNNVMAGKSIDPDQTWKTTEAEKVTVTSQLSGTLKIYTANPHGNVAAALLTQTIEAGSYEFTVTKPQDAEQLYAKLTLDNGSIRVVQVNNGAVSFDAPGTMANAPRRAQKKYDKDFPDAPDASSYKSSKDPNATTKLTGYLKSANPVYIDETASDYGDLQIDPDWVDGDNVYADLYVVKNSSTGICAPKKLYISSRYQDWSHGGAVYPENKRPHLYICSGATLKLTSYDSGNMQAGLVVYIANGGTLECDGELKLNSFTIYNNGTIKAPVISANGTGVLYNQNKVEVAGDLTVTNASSYLVNEGVIEVGGNYGSQGSGSFWNVSGSTMTVTGNTIVNSNCNGWINEGVYSTGGNFEYTAGSVDVWNNCKLTVGGQFYMVLGASPANGFSMESGASVVAETAYIGACTRINMGGNSLFKVNGTMTMNNTNHAIANGTEGFFGPTTGDEYAVIQAENIVRGAAGDNNARYVAYVGNVYVAADSHFAEGPSGQDVDKDYYLFGNAKIYNGQNAAPYTVPANGRCNAGYNGGGGGGNEEPTMYYYYAFEDLGAIGDFDFNDVVLRLAAPNNGQSTVQLVAAGGTLPVQVIYKGNNVGEEVHKEFDVDTKTMVNTGSGEKKDFVDLGTVNIASDARMDALPFGIKVTGNNGETVTVTNEVDHTGTAPLMIVVAGYSAELEGIDKADIGKWFWARERVNISTAYSQFGAWGADVKNNKNWYYYFTEGKVWKY